MILKHGLRRSSPNGGTASDRSPAQSDAGSNSTADNIPSESLELDRAISLQEMNDSMDGHTLPNQQQNLGFLPDQGQSSHHSGDYTHQTPPGYERGSIISASSNDRTTALSSTTPECQDCFDIGNFSIQPSNPARMDWLFQFQPEFSSGVVPGQPPTSTSVQPIQPVWTTIPSHFSTRIT